MVKDPRNPARWENTEIQQDGEAFLKAQQNFADDQAAAVVQQQEDDDRERFVQKFVEEGGRARDAENAWKAHRNQRAATIAGKAEEAALEGSRAQVRQVL